MSVANAANATATNPLLLQLLLPNVVVEWLKFLLRILKSQVQISARTSSILTEIVSGFSQTLQATARKAP
jgi:hypothetical protein